LQSKAGKSSSGVPAHNEIKTTTTRAQERDREAARLQAIKRLARQRQLSYTRRLRSFRRTAWIGLRRRPPLNGIKFPCPVCKEVHWSGRGNAPEGYYQCLTTKELVPASDIPWSAVTKRHHGFTFRSS
jgi:hypothetical protein